MIRSSPLDDRVTILLTNGATTKESWKAGRGPLPRYRDSPTCWAFNGATTEGVVEGSSIDSDRSVGFSILMKICCFNGATTKESWKAQRMPPQIVHYARMSRFNGATTKESWKAGIPTRDRPECPRNYRFNGATTKVSWKAWTRWSGKPGRAGSSFNGATTKVSWKAGRDFSFISPGPIFTVTHPQSGPRRRCRGRRQRWAELGFFVIREKLMGPRRRSRGRHRLLCAWPFDDVSLKACFNGATTKESWKASGRSAEGH